MCVNKGPKRFPIDCLLAKIIRPMATVRALYRIPFGPYSSKSNTVDKRNLHRHTFRGVVAPARDRYQLPKPGHLPPLPSSLPTSISNDKTCDSPFRSGLTKVSCLAAAPESTPTRPGSREMTGNIKKPLSTESVHGWRYHERAGIAKTH